MNNPNPQLPSFEELARLITEHIDRLDQFEPPPPGYEGSAQDTKRMYEEQVRQYRGQAAVRDAFVRGDQAEVRYWTQEYGLRPEHVREARAAAEQIRQRQPEPPEMERE